MAPLFLEYDGSHTTCRVDNNDNDGIWLTGDKNSNGIIDEDEAAGTLVEFDQLREARPQVQSVSSSFSEPSLVPGSRDTRISSPGFRDYRGPYYGGLVSSVGNVSYEVTDFHPIGIDFDDLYTFNIRFDSHSTRQLAAYQSVGVGRTIRFDNVDDEEEGPSLGGDAYLPDAIHGLEISLGARYYEIRDRFTYLGTGGLLGGLFSNTNVEDYVIGPEVGMGWETIYKRWRFFSSGSYALGYRSTSTKQVSALGEYIVPGGLSRYAPSTPLISVAQSEGETLSPIAELGASATYAPNGDMTLTLGYAGYFVGDLRFADETVDWSLPNMGIRDVPGRDFFTGTLYASIDLRR